jgi:flavin-binding protein dodecin
MSIIEIEVRGTSTANYKEALDQATRSAEKTYEDLVDLDEVSRFVEIDGGGTRRFGVTLKATCFKRD